MCPCPVNPKNRVRRCSPSCATAVSENRCGECLAHTHPSVATPPRWTATDSLGSMSTAHGSHVHGTRRNKREVVWAWPDNQLVVRHYKPLLGNNMLKDILTASTISGLPANEVILYVHDISPQQWWKTREICRMIHTPGPARRH